MKDKTNCYQSSFAPKEKCVHCGYCCRKAPCAYGLWDEEKKQCAYLKNMDTGLPQYVCDKYDAINNDPGSYISPSFGTGCCSNLNSDRRAILKQLNQNHPLRLEFANYFKKLYDSGDVNKFLLDAKEEDLFLSYKKSKEN
jgi:hypothetical protein